jgi:hypothetical protein
VAAGSCEIIGMVWTFYAVWLPIDCQDATTLPLDTDIQWAPSK